MSSIPTEDTLATESGIQTYLQNTVFASHTVKLLHQEIEDTLPSLYITLEFKSPVASGFPTCFGSNWTATGLSNIILCVDRTETCGNRLPSVAMAVTTSHDQFFTRPVLMLTMLHVL